MLSQFKIILLYLSLLLTILIFHHCNSSSEKEQKSLTFIETRAPNPFEKIAITLSEKADPAPHKVIVLTFVRQDGKDHIMGSVFAEKLTTELVKQKKMVVLDRFIYSKKLKEAGLEMKGDYDLSLLKKLGELLGVDAIAVGIISPSGKYGYDINCRLIESKTGLILSAEEAFYNEGGE
jgi:TolB-like protein